MRRARCAGNRSPYRLRDETMRTIPSLLACVLALGTSLQAQSLEQQINTVGTGEVRLTYSTKEGVCGDGRHINTGRSQDHSDRGWCEPGPARLSLELRDGRVVDADLGVGGDWNRGTGSATDLGRVPAPEAAAAVLSLIEAAAGSAGGDLVLAAVVADSVTVWPDLLRLARSSSLPEDTREDVVLWLGFAAGDALGPDDPGADDDDVRESAIFALSQRPEEEAVPALIRVIEGESPVHLKKSALFWLGQTDDTRAVDVFEEILQGS